MNNGVLVFLDSADKVSMVVEQVIVIQDTWCHWLIQPKRWSCLKSLPSLIMKCCREIWWDTSPIKVIPLGCKSPHLKYIVSFRSRAFVILKNKNWKVKLWFFKLKCIFWEVEMFLAVEWRVTSSIPVHRSEMFIAGRHTKHTTNWKLNKGLLVQFLMVRRFSSSSFWWPWCCWSRCSRSGFC